MNQQELCGIVASNLMFKDLDPTQCQRILDTSRQRRFSKGDLLFHQGEPAELFYIVIEGQVKLAQINPEGEQAILQIVGPGEGIGIIVALGNMPYPVLAEAMEDCLLSSWDKDTTRQLMLEIPKFAINGMELIAQRFTVLQSRYRELATKRVEQRVASTLLRLVRQFGRREGDGVLIDMSLTREDLAQLTGTNLYNVSRILRRWEQDDIVGLGRMRVVIHQAHKLVMISEGLT